MILFIFYLLAILSLLIGTAAIYMALIETFPVKWLYYHYFIRKPINWTILIVILLWTFYIYQQENHFPLWSLVPIILTSIAVILTYKMHQETAFKAVDFPIFTKDISILPIKDEMQLAIIEYDGITKCYPLDYVIHHHIINDKFNSRIVALTYCAMCRSIIPFDVTEIGPLFVGSFKDANMIVADKKTKTFFQQATFQSIIGKLHPYNLTMIPFQILSWSDVKKSILKPQVVNVTKKDFREFQLPIPGIWKKIVATENTPGLSSKNRDKTFPSRTHVIGLIDESIKKKIVYLKKEVISNEVVLNKEHNVFLIGIADTVNGFKNSVNNFVLNVTLDNAEILDLNSQTRWNMRGKYIKGKLNTNLEPIAISDEYWFSWKKFHKDSKLIRL
ncbi:DUF3179 domain-containing (seleno)protein [Algibacter mikhailovii]|uniref:DUF3179 domain-containing (seleno)protein n=1 Tax=Algibacter mikhailovii TaxID=425498 RepID=UPI002494CC4D|nr:DUF3179 domain-containing (seleno)protein [Algibacter mikhailovii]